MFDRHRYVYIYDCGFFFFQAEDGIRDLTVTGVQTCALPISLASRTRDLVHIRASRRIVGDSNWFKAQTSRTGRTNNNRGVRPWVTVWPFHFTVDRKSVV